MWSRVSNTCTSGLSESVKPTFLGSEVCNELYYWATRSRKTCLKRISNSHCKSRGLNVLLGRMGGQLHIFWFIARLQHKMNLSNAGNTFAIAFNPAGYKYIVLSQLPSHRQFYIFWTTDASGKIYVSFFDSTAVPHLRYLMKNKTYILKIFNRD